jgi:hypothetical protein
MPAKNTKIGEAEFTHWPGDEKNRVVDDMLKNERRAGSF